jgi:tetraacyldisaccharide 4'-kinase
MLVDPQQHSARDVGDEALLLSRAAPTIVSRDRVAGAAAARAQGADIVVMDDGLQNASLRKDFTLAVVDGLRGIGNGKVFPAGPLRAPLEAQLARCDALLVVGDRADLPGDVPKVTARANSKGLPIFHATLEPDAAAVAALTGRKALAFAGIGHPEKFFATLAAAGIEAPVQKPFPDHHRYSQEEAGELIMQAEREGLRLVTTEKDLARIAGDPGLNALATRAHALPVTLAIAEQAALEELMLGKLRR